MPAIRRLLIVLALTFVAGLLILFPARAAYHWFAPSGIAMSGLNGSIWSGSARDADIAGVYLRDTKWRIRPLRLLFGKLAYAIETSPAGGFVNGEIGVGFGGDAQLRNMRGSIPLSAVEGISAVRGIRGTLNAVVERLQFSDGLPVAADGNFEVTGLVLPLVSPSPIGNFIADFFTEADGIIASVEDTEASVDLAGRLLISDDGSYEFLGQLAPKPDTPAPVRKQMQFLGSANERGQYELRLEGSL